jgi:dihydrofolate reductase
MGSVTCHISMSLDGFVAGPNQGPDNPIGEGGLRLHEWVFRTHSWRRQQGLDGGERSVDSDVADELVQGVGAHIMGRKMFGGGDGPWDQTWTGWWGEDPPYHVPVFVLTHRAREPLAMQGGTTFTFVTAGIGSAVQQGRRAPVRRRRRSEPRTGRSSRLPRGHPRQIPRPAIAGQVVPGSGLQAGPCLPRTECAPYPARRNDAPGGGHVHAHA